MPNSLLTPQVITNELLRRFKNNLGFAGTLRREYDDRFAQTGGKIGDTLNVRVPVRFGASDGATLVVQDVTETKIPLVINKQKHVGFEFTSKDQTLTIDRFGERYLDSAAIALANQVDVDLLTMAYQSTYNSVGTPGTIPSTLKLYGQARAKLDKFACPVDNNRYAALTPDMETELVDAAKGLFHASSEIDNQYLKGYMGKTQGFNFLMDQNMRVHTVGPLGGSPQVNGANQTGATLATKGWTSSAASRLVVGDTFTIAGVYAVNPVSGDTQADLQQFVVTAAFSSDGSGNGSISISPSIITSGPTKTVSASPADSANITVIGAAGTLTPQGLAYHREAFAWAMAPMDLPKGVHMAARSIDKDTGVSIRMVSQYDIVNDLFVTRADILYGSVATIPAWSCRVQS